jgi:outer membrane immunogenic protein
LRRRWDCRAITWRRDWRRRDGGLDFHRRDFSYEHQRRRRDGRGSDQTLHSLQLFRLQSIHGNANGVIGGAHVGYTHQINQFVLGLEGDVDGSSLSKTVNFAPFSNYYQDYIPTTVHSNLGVQGSIRGRFGYAFDRLLVYATGGVAFGGFNTSISTAYTNALFYPAFSGTDSFSNTRVGWTVGGGLEYAVTNNWSIRAEYRYTDFGPSNNVLVNSFPGFNGDFLGARVHTNLIENRVQVGFSYKFDTATPAPVVAKY